MGRKIDEQLSALMDGELSSDEMRFVLRRAAGDASLVQCWSRYHIARHALRREQVVFSDPEFARCVHAALAAEPAVRSRSRQWLRRGSGGAIAAAVAAAALLVGQPGEPDQEAGLAVRPAPSASMMQPATAPASPTPIVLANGSRGSSRPLLLSGQPVPVQQAAARTTSTPGLALDSRTQRYLIGHYEAGGGHGGQSGFVPYMLLTPPAKDGRSASEHAPSH